MMTFNDIRSEYGARDFHGALSKFLVRYANPQASRSELQNTISHFNFDFSRVPVFQKVKIWIQDLQGRTEADDTLDVVHVRRRSRARSGRKLSTRFDTVLIDTSTDSGPSECGDIQGKSHALNDMV